MREEFKQSIEKGITSGYTADKILYLIQYEYEFDCPSFVYAGPGHQSRHECRNHNPHDLDGEHGDDLYDWIGTARREPLPLECIVCKGSGRHHDRECYVCSGTGNRHEIINTHHEGYSCPCTIPEDARV